MYASRFVIVRIMFYVAIAYFVREGVKPASSAPEVMVQTMIQSEAKSSDFASWATTFPSRLERAMDTGVAE